MKAIYCNQYGSPAQLELKELPRPSPKKKEVLVKIHATAINDYDWSLVRGKPFIYRLMFGFNKPKQPIPGMELAGVIEELGDEVSIFKVGDAVYGDISNHGFGTFAEYICVDERALVIKPDSIPFEEAAAIPHAAMLAYQGLVVKGEIKQNQKILINGAGGGVGTFAFQLAKLYDAEVTGVDTGEKLKTMKALGFDHIIDYKKTDFTKEQKQYDLILDPRTTRAPWAFLKALKAGGKYVTVGGKLRRLIQLVVFKPFISIFTDKKLRLLALEPNKDLAYINSLYEAGKVKAVIDGPYPLEETPRLIQYFGDAHHTGKIVISLVETTST